MRNLKGKNACDYKRVYVLIWENGMKRRNQDSRILEKGNAGFNSDEKKNVIFQLEGVHPICLRGNGK